MLTDDDKEEAQKHSTGGNGSGKLGLAESSDQGPGIHDHTDDQSPKGRTKCVSERVDGDSPGVDVQTHDEDVVQGESDETATSGRDQRESFDISAYLLEDRGRDLRSGPGDPALSTKFVCDVGNVTIRMSRVVFSDPCHAVITALNGVFVLPNVRMTHAVPPENQRGIQSTRGNDHRGDDTSSHSQDAVRPGEGKNSQDNIFDYGVRFASDVSLNRIELVYHDISSSPNNSEVAWTRVRDLSRISTISEDSSSLETLVT
jgi:hypothetical protein